jgi:hypothetical protein
MTQRKLESLNREAELLAIDASLESNREYGFNVSPLIAAAIRESELRRTAA